MKNKQIIKRHSSDSVLEIVREPDMGPIPYEGEYVLGIQQLESNPNLVEMTLYHEQTGAIAFRLGFNVTKAASIRDTIQKVLDQIAIDHSLAVLQPEPPPDLEGTL